MRISHEDFALEQRDSSTSKGYLIAVGSAVIFSTTAILISYLTETFSLPAPVLAFWRDLFAVLTLLIALGIFWPKHLKVEKRHLGFLALYGFVLAFYNIIWTTSVGVNGAAISTVLVYISPGIAAVLGKIFFNEKLNWVTVSSILVGLLGIVLVSEVMNAGIEQLNASQILIGVVPGLFWAIYGLMGKSTSNRGLNPWTSMFYTFCFATGFLFLYNLLQGGIFTSVSAPIEYMFWLETNWNGWLILFVLAAVPTVLGYGLYNMSLEFLPSSITNLILSLEPSFTIIGAYLILSERLNSMQIWGSVLIMLSVMFLRLNERKGDRVTKIAH
jgi:drug/metabolite transporter (DMT)-like permease